MTLQRQRSRANSCNDLSIRFVTFEDFADSGILERVILVYIRYAYLRQIIASRLTTWHDYSIEILIHHILEVLVHAENDLTSQLDRVVVLKSGNRDLKKKRLFDNSF
jgi:hypothetical protein